MEQKNNILIPKHRKLSQEEITQILQKYSIENISMLPKIKVKDSALVDQDVVVGDVIEITRTSFAGETKYYRVVVE